MRFELQQTELVRFANGLAFQQWEGTDENGAPVEMWEPCIGGVPITEDDDQYGVDECDEGHGRDYDRDGESYYE